jgi:hypothetical protein
MSQKKLTQQAVATVLQGIVSGYQDELRALSQEDLEKYWFFQYDPSQSHAWNLYQFHSLLDLYRKQCRAWEELHHGPCCVVERVRDRYLMPKITQFLVDLEASR